MKDQTKQSFRLPIKFFQQSSTYYQDALYSSNNKNLSLQKKTTPLNKKVKIQSIMYAFNVSMDKVILWFI